MALTKEGHTSDDKTREVVSIGQAEEYLKKAVDFIKERYGTWEIGPCGVSGNELQGAVDFLVMVGVRGIQFELAAKQKEEEQ